MEPKLLRDGERTPVSFTQQPAVMEYLTEQLIATAVAELKGEQPFNLLSRYALTKASASDYIRESQIRLILEPIATPAPQSVSFRLSPQPIYPATVAATANHT